MASLNSVFARFRFQKYSNFYFLVSNNVSSYSDRGFRSLRFLSGKVFKQVFSGNSKKVKKVAVFTAAGLLVVGGLSDEFKRGWLRSYANPESREIRYNTVTDLLPAKGATNNDKNTVLVPVIKPSRTVAGPSNVGLKLTLFQYQTCPFCCKVRAFLNFYGIPYEVVEVNPVLRQQLKFSKYRKVPILLVQKKDGEYLPLVDSSAIISMLATFLIHGAKNLERVIADYEPVTYKDENGKEVTEILNKYNVMLGETNIPYSIEEKREERTWRTWVDDNLVHVLSPNIYRTMNEAGSSFKYFSQVGDWENNFSAWERYLVIYVGATAMYFVGKRLKKRHQLKEDVRESLYDAARHWMKAVGSSRKFLGGAQPNLADLAVYGVLNSIEGCEAFQDMLKHTKIGPWYYSVQKCIADHVGSRSIVYDVPNEDLEEKIIGKVTSV